MWLGSGIKNSSASFGFFSVEKVTVKTFHSAVTIKMDKSVGTATFESSKMLPTLTVETKVTKTAQWNNVGFNEIMIWINDKLAD